MIVEHDRSPSPKSTARGDCSSSAASKTAGHWDAGEQQRAAPDAAGRDLSGRRGNPAFSNFCRRRHVPEPDDTLRLPVFSNPTSEGNVQTTKGAQRASKHLLRYPAGTADFSITSKQEGNRLDAYSDTNWGNNTDDDKSTSSYTIMICNGRVRFKMGMQELPDQSTMEAELVAGSLATREAAFCQNMMTELGFKEDRKCVPLYIDNISLLPSVLRFSFPTLSERSFQPRSSRSMQNSILWNRCVVNPVSPTSLVCGSLAPTPLEHNTAATTTTPIRKLISCPTSATDVQKHRWRPPPPLNCSVCQTSIRWLADRLKRVVEMVRYICSIKLEWRGFRLLPSSKAYGGGSFFCYTG